VVTKKPLISTVFVLGLVSFFTDISSEMIYPLLPLYLTTVLGAGAFALGLMEGVADATSALINATAGRWTDRIARRKPFIVAGYALAGVSRPLIGLAAHWPMVMFLRFTDRVGKGLRTSPRDALIADITLVGARGRAFGLHRSMDHAGAVIGPLLASGLLVTFGWTLQNVFLWAAVPSVVAIVIAVFFLREPGREIVRPGDIAVEDAKGWRHAWRSLGKDFRRFMVVVMVFTLGNSADAFLLLKLSQSGLNAYWIPVLWSAHHVVKMTATYFGGQLTDVVGSRKMLTMGWIYYALVYTGFAFVETTGPLIALFFVYGAYYGFIEPAERSLVSDLVPMHLRGTAYGLFHAATGLALLPASLLFGLVWETMGSAAAFLMSAGFSGAALVLLAGLRRY
jgi:MFS family permease